MCQLLCNKTIFKTTILKAILHLSEYKRCSKHTIGFCLYALFSKTPTAVFAIFIFLACLWNCACVAQKLESTSSHDMSATSLNLAFNAPHRTQSQLLLDYENDANFNSVVDKYYTAGVALMFISKEYTRFFPSHHTPQEAQAPESTPKSSTTAQVLQALSLQRFFLPRDERESRLYSAFGISLMHEMYAPKNRFATTPPPQDHPYGGSLQLRLSAFARSRYIYETLSINLGLVGQSALAKELQDVIHDLTNNNKLSGWHTQLRDEFVANIHYGISASFPTIVEKTARTIDIMPQISASLGNARIHAQASIIARIGYNLYPNTAPLQINSAFVPTPSYIQTRWSVYGFVGVGGRIVGRNIFLQGNTFAPHFVSEHRIHLEPLIAEFIWGGALEYRRFILSYSVTHRTKEFSTQDDIANFGAITLGVKI